VSAKVAEQLLALADGAEQAGMQVGVQRYIEEARMNRPSQATATSISDIVAEHGDTLRRLCRTYRVVRLDVFGSAARPDFDPDRSDLDFVVEFEEMPPAERADNYFGLLFELERLFQRPVDLVQLSAIRNPYFRDEVEETRLPVYVAA
jgi:predicted nucleotidyltransferase